MDRTHGAPTEERCGSGPVASGSSGGSSSSSSGVSRPSLPRATHRSVVSPLTAVPLADLSEQLRKLGDVGGDAPGLVAGEELGGRCWYIRAAQHARGQLHRCRARLVVNAFDDAASSSAAG
jgi:hypothetical protein